MKNTKDEIEKEKSRIPVYMRLDMRTLFYENVEDREPKNYNTQRKQWARVSHSDVVRSLIDIYNSSSLTISELRKAVSQYESSLQDTYPTPKQTDFDDSNFQDSYSKSTEGQGEATHLKKDVSTDPVSKECHMHGQEPVDGLALDDALNVQATFIDLTNSKHEHSSTAETRSREAYTRPTIDVTELNQDASIAPHDNIGTTNESVILDPTSDTTTDNESIDDRTEPTDDVSTDHHTQPSNEAFREQRSNTASILVNNAHPNEQEILAGFESKCTTSTWLVELQNCLSSLALQFPEVKFELNNSVGTLWVKSKKAIIFDLGVPEPVTIILGRSIPKSFELELFIRSAEGLVSRFIDIS